MPVFIYKAKWFKRGRIVQLLYALERSDGAKWSWNTCGRLFTFYGETAETACNRLNAVYPAASIIKV